MKLPMQSRPMQKSFIGNRVKLLVNQFGTRFIVG